MTVKKTKKILWLLLCSLIFSTNVFALENDLESDNYIASIEEAQEYLLSYCYVGLNQEGEEYTVTYEFDSTEDLNIVAEYIVENGVDNLDALITAAVEQDNQNSSGIAIPMTPTYSTMYRTISTSDGTKTVSGNTYGLCDFGNYGAVEYMAYLSYKIKVTGGVMEQVTGISFNIPSISTGGGYSNLSFPSYCTGTQAGVTANYHITKTVSIPIGDGGFNLVSESDTENFAVLTSFE